MNWTSLDSTSKAGQARWAAQEKPSISRERGYCLVCVDCKLRRHSRCCPVTKLRYCYQPGGVVEVISPWNYPMTLRCRFSATRWAIDGDV